MSSADRTHDELGYEKRPLRHKRSAKDRILTGDVVRSPDGSAQRAIGFFQENVFEFVKRTKVKIIFVQICMFPHVTGIFMVMRQNFGSGKIAVLCVWHEVCGIA